jgi:hypothetical protein
MNTHCIPQVYFGAPWIIQTHSFFGDDRRTKFRLLMVEAIPLLLHSFWILRGMEAAWELTTLRK